MSLRSLALLPALAATLALAAGGLASAAPAAANTAQAQAVQPAVNDPKAGKGKSGKSFYCNMGQAAPQGGPAPAGRGLASGNDGDGEHDTSHGGGDKGGDKGGGKSTPVGASGAPASAATLQQGQQSAVTPQ